MKKLYAILIGTLCLITSSVNAQLSFSPSISFGCAPMFVNFTNTSSIGVHFYWSFGDGNYANDVTNPTHVYLNQGDFLVTMEAYDASWAYLGNTSFLMDVEGATQGLMENYTVACPGTIISFFTPSSGYAYSWDFGDGFTASTPIGETMVQHTYTTPGTYYTSMTYYNDYCGQYYTSYDSIVIDGALPWFTGWPDMGTYGNDVCPGTSVQGYVYGGPYSSYMWSSGEGDFSTDQFAEFTYENLGVYTLSVTLMNGCGVDTTLYETINVNNSVAAPTVPIGGPSIVCPGEDAYWMVTTAPPGLTYTWDFGDGTPLISSNENYAYHTYPTAGNYVIELTAENLCGNSTTSYFNVDVDPAAPVTNVYFDAYPSTGCPGDEIEFLVGGNFDYYIDFGDGSGTTTDYDHAYMNEGTYPVYAILQNSCGQTLTVYDTVNIVNNMPMSPNIYVGANPDPACPESNIEFYADDSYSEYHWNFGDGGTANSYSVMHPYLNTGTYNASVTIVNGCGADTTITISVDVVDNLPIDQYFEWGVYANQVCPGTEIYMSVDEGEQYDLVWDFGDGNGGTGDLASHSYAAPGNYTVTLTAVNGCGSDTTVTHVVNVANGITPTLSEYDFEIQSPGCIGDNLYFAVVPAGLGTYSWDFGDGQSGVSDELLYVEDVPFMVGFHAYTNAGTYYPTLTITNACGNSIDTTVEVVVGGVGQPVQADVHFFLNQAQSESICEGQPVAFSAVGAGTYIWDFGDGSGTLITYNSLQLVEHIYAEDGSYTVTLTGINACGGSDNDQNEIFIPNSDLDVVTNTVMEADCGINNGMAIVSASGGVPPYNYSWTNGDQGVVADSLGSGIYVVTITDNNGCSTEATATVSDDQGPVILLENIVDNDCYGQDNGVISVSVLGGAPPYDILWSNGETSEDIFGLEAGPYEIFVTDANGCFAVKSFEVQQPAESILSIFTAPATCGMNNGQAAAAVNNGTPPYNFIWPNGSGSASETAGLAPGVYNLMVIDGNTCLLQSQFAVNEENGPIIVTDSIADPTCSGALSAIYISTIGGMAPFDYTWSNATTNQDLTGVLPGNYSVEVEGADGCSSFMFYEVEMSAPDETNICMVTVDSLTNSNIVVWVPVNSPDVVSYNIYKESSQSGLYFLVANQSADSISQYYDYPSNPAIRSWRYKVAAVDDCGNEAELSDPHKTIHLTSNLGVGGVVNLIWDHYNGFDYDSYYIHRYHPSTGWMMIDAVSALNISYTDLNPPSDSNLVYVVEVLPPSTCTALKVQDHNSSRSNKSSINMPGGGDNSAIEENESEFSIYPNPTNGLVQMLNTTIISEVRIYDLSGQLVYQASNGTNTFSLDCSAFADGVYTVQITTENGILHSKLVKQ